MVTEKRLKAAWDAYNNPENFGRAMEAAIQASDDAAWEPIGGAPCDGSTVIVYAPPPDPEKWHEAVCDLPAIICTAAYHEDAGFCIDTIRNPTHFRLNPTPPKA